MRRGGGFNWGYIGEDIGESWELLQVSRYYFLSHSAFSHLSTHSSESFEQRESGANLGTQII